MLRMDWLRSAALLGMAGICWVVGTGCEQLPGSSKQQGAAIGGLGGAAAGAAVAGEHHRLLGALLGGALGAGGGYLVGAHSDRISHRDRAGAEEAVRNAQAHPATPAMAQSAATADLNNDGFVTMDEVVALRQAGLVDQQIIEKLRATGQVFELTPQQQDYLRSNGVSPSVISQMPQLNRELRDRLLTPAPSGTPTDGVISQPPTPPPPPRY